MSNRFYYNTRKGKGNTRAQPVCVQVTGGKKTTPKKKPTKPQGGKKTTKKPTKKLVFAGSGKTNCAGKGTPVKNAQGCAAAAKAMKRAYGGSSATKFTQFPKGCFGYKGKFSYNAGKTGKGKAGASPVCVMTGGATKKPSGKKLVMAAKGKANCAGKGTPVKSLNACKSAAKAMKKSFYPKTLTSTGYPKGCFFMSNRFYYNSRVGKGNTRAQPVCVQVTGGKKTTPKKKPTKPQGGKKTTPKKGGNTPKYQLARGKRVCPSKTTLDVKGCQAAAKALKKSYGGKQFSSQRPGGCYFYTPMGRMYFNAVKSKAWGGSMIVVCKSGATGGKKTTPKKGGNPCAKSNGGCNKLRKCTNVKGKAVCGACPKGYTNSGTKQCKKGTTTTKKYIVLADKNKANCAGKGTPVKDEKGCRNAAKAKKKAFQSAVSSSSYPKGCFYLNNRFYYNKRTGKANKNAQPACVTTKAPAKKPTKKLVFAGSGKTNCAGKGTPVKNAQGCAAAAKAMKRAYGGASATKFTQFPKGCFGYKGKFSYNAGKTGKGKAGASPVCVSTGSANTKPKLVLAAKNKANCAGKGAAVKSFNACKSAAKAMKKSFYAKPLNSVSYPAGCFFMSNRLYYNNFRKGKANTRAQPVCVTPATKK